MMALLVFRLISCISLTLLLNANLIHNTYVPLMNTFTPYHPPSHIPVPPDQPYHVINTAPVTIPPRTNIIMTIPCTLPHSRNYLSPTLVHEYFQGSKLRQSTPTNAICMTKILPKEPFFTWRCYIPRPLMLMCLLALWSSLATAQSTSVTALHLGLLYNCSQPRHFGISGFPSLSNCSHNMLQQDAPVSTFPGEVLRYSPVATIISIYIAR